MLFKLFHLMHSRQFCTPYIASRLPSVCRQFSRRFSFPGKMSSGRSSNLTRDCHQTIGVDETSPDVSTGEKGRYSQVKLQAFQQRKVDIVPEHLKSWAASDPVHGKEFPPLSASIGSSSKSKRENKIDLTPVEQRLEERPRDTSGSSSKAKRRTKIDLTPVRQIFKERPGGTGSMQLEVSSAAKVLSAEDDSLLPTSFGKKRLPSPIKRRKFGQIHRKSSVAVETDTPKSLPVLEKFDICQSEGRRSSVTNSPLNAETKEEDVEMKNPMRRTQQVLRPGMVLLKGYITLEEQVQIVKICRELGLGPGGFYQPSYRDGAKLRLQMMCLGLAWDPETRKYQNQRTVDGAKAPDVPCEFNSLVKRTIQDAHALIEERVGVRNTVDSFPDMSPNLCVVNFYTTSGRLGLHQDRDESKESLRKGLPVVSFSVGDSAEFLYGDQRDVNNAEKLLLESGDVLIFGGQSRHIFHRVQSIVPNSTPPALLEEVKLRPGRLNLTFRQY